MNDPFGVTILTLTIWTFLAPVASEFPDCWSHPPEPDPRKPADFVAWAQECSSRGITDNAWDTYLELEPTMPELPAEARPEISYAVHWAWEAERFSAASAWLDSAWPTFEILRRGSKRLACYVPLERNGDYLLDVEAPKRRPVRVAARGVAAHGWREFYEGRPEQVMSDAVMLLRVAHHMDQATTVRGKAGTGAFARMIYRDLLLQYLDRVPAQSKTAERWISKIIEVDPPYWPGLRTVMMQYARVADLYQRIYRPDSESDKLVMDRLLIEPFRGRFPAMRKLSDEEFNDALPASDYEDSLRFLRRYHDRMAELVDEPCVRALEEVEKLEAARKVEGTLLTRTTIRRLRRYYVERQMTIATRRATHLVYAIWAQRERTGAFPAGLGELRVPGLCEIRRDPFSLGDFVYVPGEDNFRLYSMGLDFADQGGAHSRDWGATEAADYVFWPVQPITPPWKRPRILIMSDGRIIEQRRDGSTEPTSQPAVEESAAGPEADDKPDAPTNDGVEANHADRTPG